MSQLLLPDRLAGLLPEDERQTLRPPGAVAIVDGRVARWRWFHPAEAG